MASRMHASGESASVIAEAALAVSRALAEQDNNARLS